MWICIDGITDDVIRFQDKSKLWTTISQLIFEIKRWSKSQDIGNVHDYAAGMFSFRYQNVFEISRYIMGGLENRRYLAPNRWQIITWINDDELPAS